MLMKTTQTILETAGKSPLQSALEDTTTENVPNTEQWWLKADSEDQKTAILNSVRSVATNGGGRSWMGFVRVVAEILNHNGHAHTRSWQLSKDPGTGRQELMQTHGQEQELERTHSQGQGDTRFDIVHGVVNHGKQRYPTRCWAMFPVDTQLDRVARKVVGTVTFESFKLDDDDRD